MYDQQSFVNRGLIARILLTLCVPLLLLVLRSLLRRREERQLVTSLLQNLVRQFLSQ